ncbi:hypothetical protein [Nocardia sp. CY41]|uniref:hypothetical protein n=1 Tax=Nocardia sp. CY41 TaxID=2608686 RepID=UPI00135B8611|nr:hypothetical protein [Nocardia sp. CY41]
MRRRRTAQICPGCGEQKVLAFYDEQRRPACTACTGNTSSFACRDCGREDNVFGACCATCTLRHRLTALLSDDTGQVHPQLRPVYNTLLTGPRPQTTLYWLTRRSSRPDILRLMARGEMAISHAAFDDLPCNRNVNYIRDLLAATGVLPPYQPLVARIPSWLGDLLTAQLEIPKPPTSLPEVVLSDEQRWDHVETLLHDDTIHLYARIGGLFMLLFAQPVSRICRMRAHQITTHTDAVTVTFDTEPIELPDPLDQLIRDHLTRPGWASYVSRPDQWLFPGGVPGKHLTTESMRSRLVARGIHPSHARKAAMFQLAAAMPVPVLADLLGLAPQTAVRWAALSARDWGQYTAIRHDGVAAVR